jgi:ArsR family transcriptional regulator
VSKHLRHLRNAGLVARRKDGLQVFYWLNDPVVEKLGHLVCESLLDEFELEEGEENPCEDAG